MADLTRPISYRGLQLNDAGPVQGTDKIVGVQIDRFYMGPVQGIGYTEKRALDDGRDASDVYLDGRRIALSGTVYGFTRADGFDRKGELMAALTPTGAYLEEPGDKGYLPLEWDEPTNDTDFDVDGDGLRYRHKYANVRPLAVPEQDMIRDRTGGDNAKGLSVPFTAMFEAVDPRIYGDRIQVFFDDIDNVAHTKNATAQTFRNRGKYPAPLNLLFVVPAAQAKPGILLLTAGGSIMRIVIPQSANEQVFRYNGIKKVLTVEELSMEITRRDLLTFDSETTHPKIPPGDSAWSFTSVISEIAGVSSPSSYMDIPVGVNVNSRVWFDEAYA